MKKKTFIVTLMIICLVLGACSSNNDAKKEEGLETSEIEKMSKQISDGKTFNSNLSCYAEFNNDGAIGKFKQDGSINIQKNETSFNGTFSFLNPENDDVIDSTKINLYYKEGNLTSEGIPDGAMYPFYLPEDFATYFTAEGEIKKDKDEKTFHYKNKDNAEIELILSNNNEIEKIIVTSKDNSSSIKYEFTDIKLTESVKEEKTNIVDDENNKETNESNQDIYSNKQDVPTSNYDAKNESDTNNTKPIIDSGSSSETNDNFIPPVTEEPQYACPTVPHHMEGGIEVWEGDPNLPCDWTPYPLGNTGLLFDTEQELIEYAQSKHWSGDEYTTHYIHYNGGYTKYSISYKGQ